MISSLMLFLSIFVILHVLDVLVHRGCNVQPVPVGLARTSCDVTRLAHGVLVVVLHGSPRDASFR